MNKSGELCRLSDYIFTVAPNVLGSSVWKSRDNSVGIATRYGLDSPGIETQWGEIFRTCADRPGDHTAPSIMGTGSFSGTKSGRGVTLTPHPLLVPSSRKGRAIPLLPIWAVRPVQGLSACTRLHFNFFLIKS